MGPSTIRAGLVWLLVLAVAVVPLGVAATSPLLAWRQPVYIAAGLAGVVALVLLIVQPLLIGGALPGLVGMRGRRLHRVFGTLLVAATIVHVGGLWITSPPDVVDALVFRSPTPFSVWGVGAMWALLAAALVAAWRRRIPARLWRSLHSVAVSVVVITGTLHALLVEGTMGTLSKVILCAAVVAASAWTLSTRPFLRRLLRG
jgi:predicted ferric reductase